MVFDEIEAKLSAWGIQGGVHALVLRWREQALALEHASLRWEHQFDPGFPERQQESHDLGIFTLDATNVEGEWVGVHGRRADADRLGHVLPISQCLAFYYSS